jgi:hypothetical protein
MNLFSVALAVVVGSWLAIPNGEWSPAPEQVSELRNSLEPFIKQQALTQHLQLPKWQNYTFQFQGQVDERQKIIFVNAFCISPPAQAKLQFVHVFDGGPCFFQVKYNPVKKEFYQLMFNGEA